MAKAKTTPSPKKSKANGKAKAAASPDQALRRSPRKTVASTKNAEAEQTARVTKKASPAKKTSAVKKLADVLKKPAIAKKVLETAVKPAVTTTKATSPAPKKAAAAKAKSPARKTSVTPAAKKATLAKSNSPALKKSVSPVVKKTAAPTARASAAKEAQSASPAKSATASPRPRGRPRKNVPLEESATASPKPRGRPPKDGAVSKVTKPKSKPNPKKGVAQKRRPKEWKIEDELLALEDVSDHILDRSLFGGMTEEEFCGIREDGTLDLSTDSITSDSDESPSGLDSAFTALSGHSKSKSPAKTRTTSASSRLESPTAQGKAASGRSSVEKKRGPVSPSKSPTKAAPLSPKKDAAAARNRSRSPAKAAGATTTRKASGAGVRGRSKSPAKGQSGSRSRHASGPSTRLHSQSPTKVTKPSSPRKISVAAGRRSQSPAKGNRNNALQGLRFPGADLSGFESNQDFIAFDAEDDQGNALPLFNYTSGVETNPRTGREMDVDMMRRGWKEDWGPGSGPDGGNAVWEATQEAKFMSRRSTSRGRASHSRSPAKKAIRSPIRSLTRKASASSPTKKPTGSATEAAPATRSPTKAAGFKSGADVRWDEIFNANDEYGKTLRKLEMKAYTAKKDDKVFRGASPIVDDDDGARARRQGVDRARVEFALRNLADGREQGAREGYRDRVVDLDSSDESDEGGKGSRFVVEAKGKTPKRPSSSTSPQRKTSSSSQQQPPLPNIGRNKSPARRPSGYATRDEDFFYPLAPGQPSAPDRGAVHSITNPQRITGTNQENPFFETMPGPEYWHRNQPPYFMFGETPYMQQEISRQLNQDLKKGAGGSDQEPEKPRSGSIGGMLSFIPLFNKSKDRVPSPEQSVQRQSPFALPEVTEEQVDAMLRDVSRAGGQRRRDAGSASPSRDPRRPRRMSGGNGSRSRSKSRSPPATYHMSGALSLM